MWVTPFFALADSEGQTKDFFVNPSFDVKNREQVAAVLQKVSQKAYFYVEKDWWQGLAEEKRRTAISILNALADEFDNKIYPKLTAVFGSEWKPGVDNDERITILFHQFREGAAGYFKSDDEFMKLQAPISNEREMIYLNASYLFYEIIKSLTAHEFTHLIEYNQKTRLKGAEEEVWLSEMRAEYAPTIVGYDDNYAGSNLQSRVKVFLENPNNSLVDWNNQSADYGVISVFGQYLAEKYGVKVLADSLLSRLKGIASLNEALVKTGSPKNFNQIFTDWVVAVFLNDCQVGEIYCYENKNLTNFKVAPSLIFLPPTQKTEFSLSYNTPFFSGNWYHIIGGQGDLSVDFSSESWGQFQIPYVLCPKEGECSVAFLQAGEISLPDFDQKWKSVTLIPSAQPQNVDFQAHSPLYPFSILAKVSSQRQEAELIAALQAQIIQLKAQIAEVQRKLAQLKQPQIICRNIQVSLSFGSRGNEVRCLQSFLKSQGKDIYPEGLVTGYFGVLTQRAVVRFQEKYASEILTPLGLQKGSGVVDYLTRLKINQLFSG